MFREDKDERLVFVNHRAGFYAFFTLQALLLAAMFFDAFLNRSEAIDRSMLMFLPWCIGTGVFVILLLRGGYMAAVREENTRDASSRLSMRLRVLVTTLLFGAISFGIMRLFPGSSGPRPVEDDARGAAISAVIVGAIWWWMNARRPRPRASDADADQTAER
jgi:hypothetical protein